MYWSNYLWQTVLMNIFNLKWFKNTVNLGYFLSTNNDEVNEIERRLDARNYTLFFLKFVMKSHNVDWKTKLQIYLNKWYPMSQGLFLNRAFCNVRDIFEWKVLCRIFRWTKENLVQAWALRIIQRTQIHGT